MKRAAAWAVLTLAAVIFVGGLSAIAYFNGGGWPAVATVWGGVTGGVALAWVAAWAIATLTDR